MNKHVAKRRVIQCVIGLSVSALLTWGILWVFSLSHDTRVAVAISFSPLLIGMIAGWIPMITNLIMGDNLFRPGPPLTRSGYGDTVRSSNR